MTGELLILTNDQFQGELLILTNDQFQELNDITRAYLEQEYNVAIIFQMNMVLGQRQIEKVDWKQEGFWATERLSDWATERLSDWATERLSDDIARIKEDFITEFLGGDWDTVAGSGTTGVAAINSWYDLS
jgi:hypothetical protein